METVTKPPAQAVEGPRADPRMTGKLNPHSGRSRFDRDRRGLVDNQITLLEHPQRDLEIDRDHRIHWFEEPSVERKISSVGADQRSQCAFKVLHPSVIMHITALALVSGPIGRIEVTD